MAAFFYQPCTSESQHTKPSLQGLRVTALSTGSDVVRTEDFEGPSTHARASIQGLTRKGTGGWSPIVLIAEDSCLQILGQWGVNKRNSKGGKEVEEADKEETVNSRNSLTGLLMSRSENAAKPPASPVPDIDADDRGDPLAASEYAEDIFAYYRRVESVFRTAPDYMKEQVRLWHKLAPQRHDCSEVPLGALNAPHVRLAKCE